MVNYTDIQAAAERLEGLVKRTDVTSDSALEARYGSKIYLKWENHQITGSFKVRGALNTILSLPPVQLKYGVVGSSSGNHGSGLCYAAKHTGISIIVCVPEYASQKKISTMRDLGAEVRICGGSYELAEKTAIALADENGALFVSPYNHPGVIAGQGTVMLEWLEQIPELDTIILPIGGGGLGSGVGLALKTIQPGSRLIGVQTEGSPFIYINWHGGDMNSTEVKPNLAEGLTGRIDPHSLTLELTKQLFDDVILVNDEEIADAVAYCYHTHDEIVEGAGATALAALLAGKAGKIGNSVGVVITGGNITQEQHQKIMARSDRAHGERKLKP